MHDIITLFSNIKVNPNASLEIVHSDDGKVPANRKSDAVLAEFRKRFCYDKIGMPKAEFEIIKTKNRTAAKGIPKEYIVFKPPDDSDDEDVVDYDCDEEDFNWMELANEQRRKERKTSISHTGLEYIMDRLEKESQFEIREQHAALPGSSGDSDDVCCVCADGDVSNANQIIYCDMCNIAVHQECYGVPYIPEGQWLCRKCKLSPSAPVECCLCPNLGGAYKQTKDNKWVHVICAIWLNEVHFSNAVFLEPIEGVDECLKKRSKLKCLVCRKKMGACLQCSYRSCLKAFHVTCAQQSGMSMIVSAVDDDNDPDGMDVQRFIYCHLHDHEAGDVNQKKKRMEHAIRNARRTMAADSERKPVMNMPSISAEAISQIAENSEIDIEEIVEYWYLKRQSRCGVPLIRKLQARVSRPSFSAECLNSEDQGPYNALVRQRITSEICRLLFGQLKKREIFKREYVNRCNDIFELTLKPWQALVQDILQKLIKKDSQKVFTQPVNGIEGYSKIVKHPMDISTMQKKLDTMKYTSIADARSDFYLMMENCEKFNASNQWYLQYGKKLRKSGSSMFSNAQSMWEQMEKIQASPETMQAASEVLLSNHLNSLDSNEEGTEESVEDEPKRIVSKPRRTIVLTSEHSVTEKETPLPFMKGAIKRKAEKSTVITSTSKKKKKFESNGGHQVSMLQFLTPKAVAPIEKRTLRNTPLLAYRDLPQVTSPLMADLASSESSADEEDGSRISKRRPRLAAINGTAKAELLSDLDTFQHNDLVWIDSTAGRVIDPSQASLEENIPRALLSECRSSSKRESKICVMLFGTENKWGWYAPDSLKALNPLGDNHGISAPSFREAKKWHKKVMDSFK